MSQHSSNSLSIKEKINESENSQRSKLRPRDPRKSAKNIPNIKTKVKSNEKNVSEADTKENLGSVSVKLPKLDDKLFSLYFTNETDQVELDNEIETSKQKMNSPLFVIKGADDETVKKRGRKNSTDAKNKKRSKKNLKVENKSVLIEKKDKNNIKIKEDNNTVLPNVEEAQIVDNEYDRPQDYSVTDGESSLVKDRSTFTEIDINLDAVDVKIDGISDEELKQKLRKSLSKKKKNESCTDQICESSLDCSGKRSEDLVENNEVSLKQLVEKFLSNPQIEQANNTDFLKRGLCSVWLTNNFSCARDHCIYSHNASKLFMKKLRIHPSKFLLVLVASMRNDELFVDVIMAAFKILSQRKTPVLWITFLIYFVFSFTEPSDRRFLKFWANAARFFCQIKQIYGAANGFASLLCIFSQGEGSDEKKIIEFIKVIQKPPIQIRVTYALLNPILDLKLPTSFLVAAIETAIDTQVDVMKVYTVIIPKISLKNLPLDYVEILIKFCLNLESINEKQAANDLRQRLRPKIQQCKIKIAKEDFPFCAKFQEDVQKIPKNTCDTPVENSEDLNGKLKDLENENNYFESTKKKFLDEIIQAMDLGSTKIPPRFRTKPKIVENTQATVNVDSQEKVTREEQIQKVILLFNNQQFESLGKYLNELRSDTQLMAAEELLKSLFQMKISLQQVVDLIKLMIFLCKTENAGKVVASISVTIILNLVKIGEWDKAYVLASSCLDKEIKLVEGMVFVSQEFLPFSQLKIALVIVELYLFKKNFRSALEFVKKHWLYSPNRTRWKINWKDFDEIIRIKILEEFLCLLILDRSTEMAHELFVLISREQKEMHRPIDLNKFASEVFILLLNQNNEEAVFLYEKMKLKFQLNDNVIRTILIAMVRQKRLAEAKNMLLSYNQSIYILPQIAFGVITAKIPTIWLEEEIYIYFDCLFDLLAIKKKNKGLVGFSNYGQFEILVDISSEETIVPSTITPLCLSLVDCSLESSFIRVQKVLQTKFSPPLSLIDNFDSLRLDDEALNLYINNRIGSSM